MRKIICFLMLLLLFVNCSPFKNQGFRNNGSGKSGVIRIPQFDDTSGTFLWSHYDASKRGSVMYVKDGKIRVLAENSPDAAFQTLNEISAKTKIKGEIDAEVAVKTQRSIAELGKRTAAVNMLRDALYRLNEMYYATVDENTETKKMLKSNPELMTVFQSDDKKGNLEILRNNLKTLNTLDNETIQNLFKNIIDNAKEIAIEEAKSEVEITKAESSASIKSSEEKLKKLEIVNLLISKIDGKLSKDEVDELIKEHLKN